MSDTHALAAAIGRRIRSETRAAAGRAVLWHCLGFATLTVLAGAGLASALFGYSFLADGRPSAEKIASVIAEALGRSEFKAKATGSVTLADGSEVGLAQGAEVRLAPGARVRLDPNAVVRADATITQPRLSDRQLQPETVAPSGAAVNTSYTQFKFVPFGTGNVVSGWKFNTSEDLAPVSQYCYFAQDVDTEASINVNLGTEGRYEPGTASASVIDTKSAYQSCSWYR